MHHSNRPYATILEKFLQVTACVRTWGAPYDLVPMIPPTHRPPSSSTYDSVQEYHDPLLPAFYTWLVLAGRGWVHARSARRTVVSCEGAASYY